MKNASLLNSHACDRFIELEGRRITLRLSVLALAKICRDLEAPNPQILAAVLRHKDPQKRQAVFRIMFRHLCVETPPDISKAGLVSVIPVLTEMIEEAFHASN
jgi:hypothetical protein